VNSTILVASLLLAFSPAALASSSAEKFRNEKVIVSECTLAPGAAEALPDAHPSIIVSISGGIITIGDKADTRTVAKGQPETLAANSQPIHNAGSAPLHYVRIDFLTSGSSETWGMTGLAPNYKVLAEDKYARTYDIRIPPHGFEPQHTHHARVVVALSGATLEHILPGGTHQPSTLKTGEIAWRPAATHIGHNLGDTPLWVIAVEPK
jgi:hypothetical protein